MSPPLLIVTGLSGAGISTALKDLEDFGYEVFDNIPPALIAPLLVFMELCESPALGPRRRRRVCRNRGLRGSARLSKPPHAIDRKPALRS